MVELCIAFIVAGGWLSVRAARRSNAALEVAAGILMIVGLILLGYHLHKIISV